MRLLVTGGRDFADVTRLEAKLEDLDGGACLDVVIHGDCRTGADHIADRWARKRGVPVWPFPADWSEGRGAGPVRNSRMLVEAVPTHFLAMPGGAGTADMVGKARRAG